MLCSRERFVLSLLSPHPFPCSHRRDTLKFSVKISSIHCQFHISSLQRQDDADIHRFWYFLWLMIADCFIDIDEGPWTPWFAQRDWWYSCLWGAQKGEFENHGGHRQVEACKSWVFQNLHYFCNRVSLNSCSCRPIWNFLPLILTCWGSVLRLCDLLMSLQL